MVMFNTYTGMHSGPMVMVPERTDDEVNLPEGIRFVQCEAAPDGHCLSIAFAWEPPQRQHMDKS